MRAILLILICVNLLWSSDIVIDNQTGLVWQDNSDAKSIKKDMQGAQSYCSELTLGGYDDWRLPSIKELQSIVDVKHYNPATKKEFRNVVSDDYWSSTKLVSTRTNVWSIDFRSGSITNILFGELYVRCVRDR